MPYYKNSKRHIKKRRASHRKINKYQIGGTVSRENLLDLFIDMPDCKKKIIIKMHEQVENIDDIDKNINNIKTIFNHPTAFFLKDDSDKWNTEKIEKNNKNILWFITNWMERDKYKQSDLWEFFSMYISLTYLVDIETGVKLAFLIYNNSKTTSVKFTDDKDTVITSVIQYIKLHITLSRDSFGAIQFDVLKSSPLITISLEPYSEFGNFEVSYSYINYIGLIGNTRPRQENNHRKYYKNIVADMKSYIEQKQIDKQKKIEEEEKKRIEWKAKMHAENLLLKEAAIKKHRDILAQMPKSDGSKDYEGYEYYTDRDGKRFTSMDFDGNIYAFHALFDLDHYGWTKADRKALKYDEPDSASMLWAKAQLDEALGDW